MSEEDIKLIDGYFNKGWCCDLDEVYNTVMKVVKRNEQLEKDNYKLDRENQLLFESIVENYIPKSVIREKIEEYLEYDKKYKTYTYDGRENFTYQYFKAKTLKELLGEEK